MWKRDIINPEGHLTGFARYFLWNSHAKAPICLLIAYGRARRSRALSGNKEGSNHHGRTSSRMPMNQNQILLWENAYVHTYCLDSGVPTLVVYRPPSDHQVAGRGVLIDNSSLISIEASDSVHPMKGVTLSVLGSSRSSNTRRGDCSG